MKNSVLFIVVVAALFGIVQCQDFTAELNNLDFKTIISGPLTAAIEAQAIAAKTSSDFINDVGFNTDNVTGVKTVRMVNFSYSRVNPNGTSSDFTMSIPFILLMPIPYIAIENVDIEFNVKLNSVTTSTSDLVSTGNAEYNWGSGRANFKAEVSSKSSSQRTGSVSQEYGLTVRVTASQAPMPVGAERMFDILESIILQDAPEQP